jgi:hypothetical protein
MHIDVVPNRGSRPAYLLRESWREGKKIRKRTLANLSSLADGQIEAIRRVLRARSRRGGGALRGHGLGNCFRFLKQASISQRPA